ncbi:MAG: DUF350 domain-containing protein [Gammaproteobacteria bacterium]|nr:DUF350 domain-containing protein [Gammaproteobacteria bacterium]
MESMISDLQWGPIVSTIVYSVIGVIIFILAFILLDKLTPYSIHKEIEEDQNTALGIIIGATLIALAIIISAAIH